MSSTYENKMGWGQRWEFAHQFSEQMARLFAKNWANEGFAQKTSASLIFGGRPERFAHGHTFLMSDLSESLRLFIFGERPEQFAVTVALLSWAALTICSQPLIFPVQSEWIALSRSFLANERWANEQIPNPGWVLGNLNRLSKYYKYLG